MKYINGVWVVTKLLGVGDSNTTKKERSHYYPWLFAIPKWRLLFSRQKELFRTQEWHIVIDLKSIKIFISRLVYENVIFFYYFSEEGDLVATVIGGPGDLSEWGRRSGRSHQTAHLKIKRMAQWKLSYYKSRMELDSAKAAKIQGCIRRWAKNHSR